MSGDIQPRKRKDKKKKKEDVVEDVIYHQTTAMPSDDTNIHLHKETSTGGGLCAKCLFFILLILLGALIGLIISEHHGVTDLDSLNTESRFAQLFEGWVEGSQADHEDSEEFTLDDEDDGVQRIDESEEEQKEEEEEEDLEDDIGDDEEEKTTEEVETVEEADEEEQDTTENESQLYESENINEYEEDVDEQIEDEEDIDEDLEEEEEESTNDTDDVSSFREDGGDIDEVDEQILIKVRTKKYISTLKSEEVIEESVEKNYVAESEDSGENKKFDQEYKDEDTIKQTIVRVNSKKISLIENAEQKQESPTFSDDESHETETYNMVVKFGVGTALLVVAHVVLIQKWRTEKSGKDNGDDNTEEAECVTSDLSRRNTIVTPPSLQEIEQDIETMEEEYSEDEEDYDNDFNGILETANPKSHYRDLQSTYSNTLTPDWEPKEVRERHFSYEEDEDDELDGEEDYDDEISENEDEELLQRLEAKYGRIQQSDGEEVGNDEEEEEEDDDDDDDDNNDDEEIDDEELEEDDYSAWKRIRMPSEVMTEDTDSENERRIDKQRSGAQAIYDFENITNGDDYKILNELDKAQQNLENDAAYALTLFNKILQKYPNSPRALYGKARSLDILAEKKRSNNQLEQAIAAYQQVLKVKKVPDALFQIAAQRCIDRIRFRGLYAQSIPIHKLLIDKFPKEVKFRNHLAITYLTINKINEASLILEEILRNWPEDGVALVHYGFILKTSRNKLKESVDFLKRGIATKQEGVIDGRFYFHLGDALTRLGRKEEAMSVYTDGVINKVFLSKYQRSLYNVDRLTGKPWWKITETQHASLFQNLKNKWTAIRDEGLKLLNKKGFFQPEAENLRDVGEWKQFELYARGARNNKNCQQCPTTCKLVETIPDAIGCRRGQIKFSVMHPGTHVWPHCGPTNCRLRVHLGLKVPQNTFIRVGEEIRSWKEGKFIIFDDSFEHEVWHNGTDTRLVLIIDIWHPELSNHEKVTLSTI